jgi:hypothetical protein
MEDFIAEDKNIIEAKIKNVEDKLLSLDMQENNNPTANIRAQKDAFERELTELREKLTKF